MADVVALIVGAQMDAKEQRARAEAAEAKLAALQQAVEVMCDNVDSFALSLQAQDRLRQALAKSKE